VNEEIESEVDNPDYEGDKMNDQKFKRQVEEIECPNCGGFGAVHSIFRLNRTTVRHSIHCKWCDYSDWWNE